VPWGVEARPVTQDDRDRVRHRYELPAEFVLFVGTIEPRKNLAALASAVSAIDMPLVAAGASGGGDVGTGTGDVQFLGFLDVDDLSAVYSCASVFAYPSLAEGFGLPVAEAMAYGTPVVTSAGTSTEEVAGGAAVLVDPTDVESISDGLRTALGDAHSLRSAGLARSAELTWDRTVDATVGAYREIAR
jgi:glycosyltransferase involved in cell wall biosynthesis